jgi:glycosyltransferase involved in cell wall biosynthesis
VFGRRLMQRLRIVTPFHVGNRTIALFQTQNRGDFGLAGAGPRTAMGSARWSIPYLQELCKSLSLHTMAGPKACMTQSEPIEVSVVIPCLNEAQSIGSCIDKAWAAFQGTGIRGEVVVADNGSTDGSIEIAAQRGACVVHAPLRGYGNALRKGIEEARGQFIIMGDADDSYDFSEVPRFVAKWREGYELVLGNRFKGGIKPGAMPWSHKYLGNPALTRILNLFFEAGVGDVYCGMRGFTKQLYERIDLRTTGMEFALEFVIKAAKIGARLTEVPIPLWPDKRGRPPHLRSLRDGWRSLRFMLLYAPNWLFIGPGALLVALGIVMVLWLLPGPRQVGRIVFDIHTMVFGMIFTLLGVQIISIGLFAKVFSYAERFDPRARALERALKRVQLEHGLLAGVMLALAGFLGDAWLFWKWAASGFGPLHEIRAVIFWSLWFFLGVQVFFSSFFLSMLGVSRSTYTGDYEKT